MISLLVGRDVEEIVYAEGIRDKAAEAAADESDALTWWAESSHPAIGFLYEPAQVA